MSSTESLTDQYNMADEYKRGLINLSSVAKFYFKPAEGEHIETTVKIESEKAAAICGTVKDRGDAPVEGALVLLFKSGQDKRLIDRQFTDEEGQFSFGPIEGNVLYLIKVYKNSVKIRELEIIAE
ncbi:MAG: carboxypeptidase regulatory-like domain-containing protein [Clostridiales bacterium]|nr:carboxypeptidase regulatory-like domain-containing protein [Clostridiales bacterium]